MNKQVEKIKILAKVKKLFELANNAGSDFEAESAALKARELLKKYDLDYNDIISLKDETCHENKTVLKTNYMPIYIRYLGAAIPLLYTCRYFWGNEISLTNKSNSKYITFVGIEPDLSLAVFTFHFLNNYALRKAKDHKFKGKQKNDYLKGFSLSIYARFKKIALHKQENEEKGQELCIIKDDIISRYISREHVGIVVAKKSPKQVWSEELARGAIDGRNVEIDTALEEAKENHFESLHKMLYLN